MKTQSKTQSSRGFALIVTISMMILLALLAVGLLSLSTIATRSSSKGTAMAEARANARVALMLALGDLQKHTGPDQRITAPGGVIGENAKHPHWVGTWDSWKAGEETSGDDLPSDHSTIPSRLNQGMSPTYDEHRRDHFRTWLVSAVSSVTDDVDAPSSAAITGSSAPSVDDTGIELVGEGSLGPSKATDHVKVGLVGLQSESEAEGRLAWWVGDESTKARLLEDSFTTRGTPSIAEEIFRAQSPGNTGYQTLPGFEDLEDDQQLSSTFTRPSISLLEGLDPATAKARFHDATPFSYGLLCDVREGGMKRDLSALLERPINTREIDNSFMLYRFGNRNDQVPIQDLAAYYQLYRSQVSYSSRELRKGIQIQNPDFRNGGNNFKREYTNLYRLPVPIKVQFLLSLLSDPRTNAEKSRNPSNKDTHKLNIGITPSVTYWNPYNVPLTMSRGANNATQFRLFNLPLAIRWTKIGKNYTSTTATSLAWITNGASKSDRDTGFTAFLSGSRPIVFEPGQVRTFSLSNNNLDELKNKNTFAADRELISGWNPEKYIKLKRSDRSNNAKHIEPPTGDSDGALTFSASDQISFSIEPSEEIDLANGSALQFFNRQCSVSRAGQWMSRHFQLVSRMSGSKSSFNLDLMRSSFPGKALSIEYDPKNGSDIIAGAAPFLLVNLVAGCETNEADNQGPFGGRHFPSRPFLHSSPITGTVFIDRTDPDAFYQHGWNWWVEDINSPFEANVSVDRNNNGYYGGGYTAESGTTHVVQQEIPVAPPISIAALSHAQLGGFSIATSDLGPRASDTKSNFQTTTASGQGGLFPQTLQAIGNSYAHPHLAADQAFGDWTREFSEDIRAKTVTFADHSYLANKALWDEFCFSSITPASTEAFEGSDGGSAKEVAKEFFFGDGMLPNHRLTPYLTNFSEDELDDYFDGSSISLEGADRISAKLLVKGPFNINSTSVDAWRTLFSSLRGKDVSFLDVESSLSGKVSLDRANSKGTPVSSFSLPNGEPTSGSTSDPADPEQWTSWRELTDPEIEELSQAMVRQVQLRGPFLSLSDFINRRLDSSNTELALKGAFQAALDDPQVTINEGFRNTARTLDPAETSDLSPLFPEALEGPVAYGSAAYIDQADILRNFAGQLTPRGDTFIIRTYGDSLDKSGVVQARAWCEAVVQRVPEYIDAIDLPHLKQDELTSETNKIFGRQLRIFSFRFLNPKEI